MTICWSQKDKKCSKNKLNDFILIVFCRYLMQVWQKSVNQHLFVNTLKDDRINYLIAIFNLVFCL